MKTSKILFLKTKVVTNATTYWILPLLSSVGIFKTYHFFFLSSLFIKCFSLYLLTLNSLPILGLQILAPKGTPFVLDKEQSTLILASLKEMELRIIQHLLAWLELSPQDCFIIVELGLLP